MLRRIKIAGIVALRADGVSLCFKFPAVGVVTVAAYHAGLKHSALLKDEQRGDRVRVKQKGEKAGLIFWLQVEPRKLVKSRSQEGWSSL